MASNTFFLPVPETAWGKLCAVPLSRKEVSFIALYAAVLVGSLAEWNLWTGIAIVVDQSEVCLTACALSVAVITGTP